ncbi:hypothetical protein C8Q79DRAFT_1006242 [Trametes meyenii]|nr:hypothetical protein C8Q79DRAFT_1006242 [Trametes meyenii]
MAGHSAPPENVTDNTRVRRPHSAAYPAPAWEGNQPSGATPEQSDLYVSRTGRLWRFYVFIADVLVIGHFGVAFAPSDALFP